VKAGERLGNKPGTEGANLGKTGRFQVKLSGRRTLFSITSGKIPALS